VTDPSRVDLLAVRLEVGLALPNYRPGASVEGMEAALETCARLGWGSVWTTDHLLPDTTAPSADYAELFEALTTLAWVGGRFPAVRLGASVLVVPMRNAVVLAKELATIDALTGGRLLVGVGVGWSQREFGNLGLAERFGQRGAYLDEAIDLWRHLWSGSREPFRGRFHAFDDYRFAPLPPQGAGLPIWVGGRAREALVRAGARGDAYHSSTTGPDAYLERAPVVLAAARAAGRPEPLLSARMQVRFGPHRRPFYTLSGTPDEMAAELERFVAVGVRHVVADMVETDPARQVAAMERFDREVLARFRSNPGAGTRGASRPPRSR
jgi:alkanesulfonate monooxygenase SsuD/methylene tetrahydromethanopterin reductase-like flavin-dependent oxidoreductase (luciferase family)